MKLSYAIRTGAHPDPLDAAMAALNWSQTAESDDAYCRTRIRDLHRVFPHIGASVRQWPTLARDLEDMSLLPRIRPFQLEYRQEIHASLWKIVTGLHDALAWPNDRIADLLDRHGL